MDKEKWKAILKEKTNKQEHEHQIGFISELHRHLEYCVVKSLG
jgi:hypothetical protein